jgi:uncharacterized protein (TIGR00369 family)
MTNGEAELAHFNELVRSTPLHAEMGLNCLEYGPHTVVTMELGDAVRGAAPGSIHGGMLATLCDVASAWTLWGALEVGVEMPVTTDMHIRYYRQPQAGPLTAEANLVHRGRRLLSCECVVTDDESRVLARATATYMIVPYKGPPIAPPPPQEP